MTFNAYTHLLSPADVAKSKGCSDEAVRRAIARGEFQTVYKIKSNGAIGVPIDEANRWRGPRDVGRPKAGGNGCRRKKSKE